MTYLHTLLQQLETLEIKYTDDPSAPEKTREEVRPGSPFISFSVAPHVPVELVNPTERSGLFQVNTIISEGDTVQSLREKLAKIIGLKSDLSTLQIWRYEDPVMGPRKLPNFQDYKTGKTLLSEGNFVLDVADKRVSVNLSGKLTEVGRNLIYVVE